MKNSFNTVQYPKVSSNIFDMSYDHKLSCQMGDLVPIHIQDHLPGDMINMGSDSLLRFAPLIAPVMHRVRVTVHHFFVPNRLVWDGWEDFITGGQDPELTPALPYIQNAGVNTSDLADYLGLPITPSIDKFSAIPFAAYQMIYNDFYRDQNLIDPIDYQLADGNNSSNWGSLNQIRKRAWTHDYFTASLPFAQKGPAVEIPIATAQDVDVYHDYNGATGAFRLPNVSDTFTGSGLATVQANRPGAGIGGPAPIAMSGQGMVYEPNGTLKAYTSQLAFESATVNNLRVAFRLQEWFEKNARGGSRYIENIMAHFGVRTRDYRLQRPEYLGGSIQPMVISEVLQTSESSDTPQGNMAGHAVSAGGGKNFRYYCEEHGYVISLMSIMPVPAYQQGIPKHFSKFDKLEFGWPTFAHLGEQAVLNREIYYEDGDIQNDDTWGYVPRYSEYRYNPSRVSGEFQTNLNFWHMGRIFASRPSLNQSFIEMDDTTVNRVFAVPDPSFSKIYAHVFHRIKATRKLPKYGTPLGI